MVRRRADDGNGNAARRKAARLRRRLGARPPPRTPARQGRGPGRARRERPAWCSTCPSWWSCWPGRGSPGTRRARLVAERHLPA